MALNPITARDDNPLSNPVKHTNKPIVVLVKCAFGFEPFKVLLLMIIALNISAKSRKMVMYSPSGRFGGIARVESTWTASKMELTE